MKKISSVCLSFLFVKLIQPAKGQNTVSPNFGDHSIAEVNRLFKKLMEVEDQHDLKAVRSML